MFKWIQRAAAIALAVVALAVPSVRASSDDGLNSVRVATARFHSLEQAHKAGYSSFLSCFDQPGVGGMGQHYVDFSILDTTLNPTEPEALVYEIDPTGLELVGLEYLVPIAKWTAATPPTLFGQNFYRNDTLGVYFLHAWVWRSNPDGVFTNYNANVKLCPTA